MDSKINKTQLLWIDFETGGLDHAAHSALSFAMIKTVGPDIVNEWYVELRPSPLVVEQSALAINKIDITKAGMTYPEFKKEYMTKINEWFFGGSDWSQGYPKARVKPSKVNMPTMAGHNMVSFDRPWLRSILGSTYDGCGYHTIDTMILANFARECGFIKPDTDVKLGNLIEIFKLKNEYGELHNSLVDIKMTFKVFKHFIDLFTQPEDAWSSELLKPLQDTLEEKQEAKQLYLIPSESALEQKSGIRL